MKKLYRLLLTSSLMMATSLANASVPQYPFTQEDLVEYGKQFEGVDRIASAIKEGQGPEADIFCSGTAVKTDLSFPVYITAATCVKDFQKIGVLIGDYLIKSDGCFVHPLYEIDPQYDQAACFFSKAPTAAGTLVSYPIYEGNFEDIAQGVFTSVGYGWASNTMKMDEPLPLRQAFATLVKRCGAYVSSAGQEVSLGGNFPSGFATKGDGGGPLLWKDSNGTFQVVGVVSLENTRDSYKRNHWAPLSKDFKDLILKVGSFVKTGVDYSEQELAKIAKGLFLQDTSESWNKIVQRLQAQKETQYWIGARLTKAGQDEEAIEWYKKSAEQGFPYAYNSLFGAYYLGQGVDQNKEEAFRFARLAAENGDQDLQNRLGLYYYTGEEVQQDYREAFFYSLLAAQQGHVDAQGQLGLMYYKGEGVAQDMHQAFLWFRTAALVGSPQAMHNLGVLFFKGEGTQKDVRQAFYWIEKADKLGCPEAREALNEIVASERDASVEVPKPQEVLDLDSGTSETDTPAETPNPKEPLEEVRAGRSGEL